jgi:amino acid permease
MRVQADTHRRSTRELDFQAGVPVFFGIMVYSFEGSGSVLAIHESMADPSDFVPVLKQAGVRTCYCFWSAP